ncbi:MAG: RraA family protein [Dehalococcoidia bacterium]|jgi:regulator of RNase E activity RraA|nr:MAG: RraA family protein [Chloroflexota bacterium]|tara:strand:- start:10938 stop:11585 length:648 start_codon:yes stop_codon:yes gene_type:complete
MDLNKIINDYKEFDSATVQNAMILVRGYVDANTDYTSPDLKSYNFDKPIVGVAVTGKVTPLNEPSSKIDFNDLYGNIKKNDLPVIVVLEDVEKEKGRAAIIGDVMANMARVLGAVGMVAEGSVRDIPGIKKANMPVWGKGRVPGHGPFNLVETQTSVEVANLKINPGDLLIADEDGITRIPLDIAEETLQKCLEVRKKESEMMSETNIIKRFESY